jgi:hypothetical protein
VICRGGREPDREAEVVDPRDAAADPAERRETPVVTRREATVAVCEPGEDRPRAELRAEGLDLRAVDLGEELERERDAGCEVGEEVSCKRDLEPLEPAVDGSPECPHRD